MTASPKPQGIAKQKKHKYFKDGRTEAFIAFIGAVLIILAMLAVTLR